MAQNLNFLPFSKNLTFRFVAKLPIQNRFMSVFTENK